MIGKYVQNVIAFPTESLGSRNEALKRGKNKDASAGPSWASRQIAVAYEEHASVIESLREELNTVKARERALVNEFSERFRLMHKQGMSAGNDSNNINTSSTSSSGKSGDQEDDMPMDEMADFAKMERNARNLEQLEQKIMMQKFKEEAYKEMTQVQDQYAKQVESIEQSLQEKVSEVESLRKQSERMRIERDYYYKKQQEEKANATTTRSNNDHPQSNPHNSNIQTQNIVSPTEGQSNPSTPIGRIRTLTPSTTISTVTDTPDTLSPRELVSLSFSMNGEGNSSSPVSPTELNNTKFQQHPDFLEKLVSAIELVVVQKDKENIHSMDLTVAERHFVEHVEGMVSSSINKQKEDIELLTQNLRDATNEIQGGATLAESLELDVEQRESRICDLEEQLIIANQSIKTTADLEKMLQMVADDQKDAEKEQEDLMKRIHEVEEQRDSLLELLEGKIEGDEMMQNDDSMRVIQKFVTDVKAQNEEAMQKLTAKIGDLEDENSILRNQLDVSLDALDESSIGGTPSKQLDNDELSSQLEAKSKKVDALEEEMSKLRSDIEDAKTENKSLKDDLSTARKSTLDFKTELNAANEILQTTKGVHVREQKLEDELNNVSALLDNTIKAKTRIQAKVDFMVANNKKKQQHINKLTTQAAQLKKNINEVNTELAECQETKIKLQGDLFRSEQNNSNLLENKVLDMNGKLCYMENHQCIDPMTEDMTAGCTQKEQNKTHDNAELTEMISERDQELNILSSEIIHLKEQSCYHVNALKEKDDQIRVLKDSIRESIREPLTGYISDSDTDDENVPLPLSIPQDSGKLMGKELEELHRAKEKAEDEAKRHAENLANAKLIISSLEQSNKRMTSDLRSRLQDSNAAIVSLLDQSNKHEQESNSLRAKIEQILKSKKEMEEELLCYKKDRDSPPE